MFFEITEVSQRDTMNGTKYEHSMESFDFSSNGMLPASQFVAHVRLCDHIFGIDIPIPWKISSTTNMNSSYLRSFIGSHVSNHLDNTSAGWIVFASDRVYNRIINQFFTSSKLNSIWIER